MAEILKIYTKEQLATLSRNKLLADAVDLTDFNTGSKINSLIENNSEIVSTISMDFKEAIYKAIPVALYAGFDFDKKTGTKSTGYLKPYRKPVFYINYTGSGTSALLTISSTNMTATVTGAPGDAFDFDFTTYPSASDLVTAIDALSNWSATMVSSSDPDSDTLYQYSSEEVIDQTNYLNADGMDIMLATDIEITIPAGFGVIIDGLNVTTISADTIAAGEAYSQILSQVQTVGTAGDFAINAIDTAQGKGYISSAIDGVENVINDAAFSGGTDAETDAERKTRFTEAINSLNAGTVLGITSAIKTIDGVRSVGVRENHPFKGTNTIYVDDGTGAISSTLLASVEKVLYGDPNDLDNYPGKNAAGIGYIIEAPTISAVDITISATRRPNINVDLTEIKTDIQTDVEQYINTRQLGENILLSEVVRVGKNANAAVYDMEVVSPASNIIIDSNEFAKTGAGTGGTVSVTVSIASST